MKHANKCRNIKDIRTDMESIDFQFVELIGKKSDYVRAVSKYTKDRNVVTAAADRVIHA